MGKFIGLFEISYFAFLTPPIQCILYTLLLPTRAGNGPERLIFAHAMELWWPTGQASESIIQTPEGLAIRMSQGAKCI